MDDFELLAFYSDQESTLDELNSTSTDISNYVLIIISVNDINYLTKINQLSINGSIEKSFSSISSSSSDMNDDFMAFVTSHCDALKIKA